MPQSHHFKYSIHLGMTGLETHLTHSANVQSDKKAPVWYSIITNGRGYVCSECTMEENETMFLTNCVKPRCELGKASTKARPCDCGKPLCALSREELTGSQYGTLIIWYIHSRVWECGGAFVLLQYDTTWRLNKIFSEQHIKTLHTGSA